MWGSGPYQKITETIADVHETLIGRLQPKPGDSWLDLASPKTIIAKATRLRTIASGCSCSGRGNKEVCR
jgi:hypothetical protein